MFSNSFFQVVNAERYLAIVFPLKSKDITSASRTKRLLLAVWIVTFGEATAYMFAFKLGDQCLMVDIPNPSLAFGILVVAVAMPFITVVVIYIHIVIVLVRKLRFMARSSSLDQATLARSQRKMFVTVTAILVAWIICWLPIMWVILEITGARAFNIELDEGQFETMYYYVEVMSYGNSLLNPVLYFLTSADFRKAGLLLFKCKAQEKQEKAVVSGKTESSQI